jgi:radical SAM superfamily enzyme YgiQ (UPF0313 family)
MPNVANPVLPALYGNVPRVPPDEANSVYLQPSTGCPHPTCTFCALHKEPFRARTRLEFRLHLDRVREALGPAGRFRARLFLGDANAMRVPADDLASMIRLALEAFPRRAVHAYADARLHADVDPDGLARLADAGLRRVTIGLESAHAPLYRALGKPGTFADLAPSIGRLKAARIGVGLTVLLGLGGRAHRQPHVADTIADLRGRPLGAPDVVYLLRYRPEAVTPYAAASAADPDLAATDAEYRIQERAFREQLEAELLGRGVRILSGDLVPVSLA